MNVSSLIELLVNLLVSVELSDEEDVDSNFAARLYEDVMAYFDGLSDSERNFIVDKVASMSHGEVPDDRKDVLRGFPSNFGLID
ncbi:hypothetical protein [Nocardiopsis dassonvillei]|uniref:hypothetical protein n=1 Tax=Nocardiopsis dassonvillei TaxID=2014 RepID=UPI003671577B